MNGPERLIYGCGDLLEIVDDVRAKIAAGEVEGVNISFVTSEGFVKFGSAWKDDADAIWAKLHAAISTAQHDMIANGL